MNNYLLNKNSGRINLKQENGTPLYFQDTILNNDKSNYSNALKYTLQDSNLSKTYFSKKNIENIQTSIKNKVHEKTNYKYKINNQDSDQLIMIMKSIYLQYSLNKECNIMEQINILNNKVIEYCVPNVYSELMAYIKYREDISTLPLPPTLPQNLYEDKTLELNHFF